MTDKGRILNIELSGESHSDRIGVRVRGFAIGEVFDIRKLAGFMARRKPQHRNEPDVAVFDAGVSVDGDKAVITGPVIEAHIDNSDARSRDYDGLRTVLRPGHADLGAFLKYGRDGLRPGGGQFSGRMTALYCIAGNIALQILERRGVAIRAEVIEKGGQKDPSKAKEAELEAQRDGDSLGGVVRCTVSGFPGGIGGPASDGLEGSIAEWIFAIPSVKGIEFGSGFAGAALRGSENNDEYFLDGDRVVTRTNLQGGIAGGISTGMDITFNTAFKPVPSIAVSQRTVDISEMKETTVSVGGRHDVCVVDRALPVVEAMTALALYDRLAGEETEGAEEVTELDKLRRRIDETDRELIRSFCERMRISEEIAECKKAGSRRGEKTVIEDGKREAEKTAEWTVLADEGLGEYAARLYEVLAQLSREHQAEILEGKED